MSDMSKLLYPDQPNLADAMRENVTLELAGALTSRLLDAEQIWRYFSRRDEMNAEIHLEGDRPMANVRYSPITIAAERVVGYLARLYYGRGVEYRYTDVLAGMEGATVRIPHTEHGLPEGAPVSIE